MPTTFANTIDGNEILAKRSQCDYAGNDIQTAYATKSELPTATSDLTNDSGFITLSDVPAQVNADWDATSGVSEILNKPVIPSGSQLVPAATIADADKVLKVNSIGTPEWSTGGGGGGSQVNSDWDATSGVAEILNKPVPKTLTAGQGISISEGVGTITISSNVTAPVQDVTVDGTSVVSNGVAAITSPTVDQTYDATSANAQSGVAVASGISDAVAALPTNLTAAQIQALKEALGVDETLLFNTTDYYGSATLNLSEPFTNFERLKVLAVRANSDQSTPYSFSGPWCEFETAGITINSGKAFGSLTPWIFENKFWKIAVYGATSTTQFTWSSGLQKDMTSTGAGSMDSSQHSVQIKTVIGVHRIASN